MEGNYAILIQSIVHLYVSTQARVAWGISGITQYSTIWIETDFTALKHTQYLMQQQWHRKYISHITD